MLFFNQGFRLAELIPGHAQEAFPPAGRVAVLDAMDGQEDLRGGHAEDLANADGPVEHKIHVFVLEAGVEFLPLEDGFVFLHGCSPYKVI